ncbi:MAG TPA: cyclase family protein, partial [Planctomycetota bacterium]|nr:cyclase family protein [Planctomycetota bacterium]
MDRLRPRLAALLALGLLPACATATLVPSGEWIDLSWEYSDETVYWPTSGAFEHEVLASGVTESGYWYEADRFSTAAHGGTHVDAPVHFGQGRRTVDEIPIEQLTGRAVVIDVSDRALADRDYQITVQDLTDWEIEFGRIPLGAIVLLRTGYGQYWPDALRYLGTDQKGQAGVEALHFPGLHPNAAQWLANREVGAVGIDTASIDYGQSRFYDSHRVLAAHEIPVLENVARLERLPPDGAWLVALPMKIKG